MAILAAPSICCRRKIDDARRMFDKIPFRSLVYWNSVISTCVENLLICDGVGCFVNTRDDGYEPDETTMVVSLSAFY